MNHNDVADITVAEINQLRTKITALEMELSHCRESHTKLEDVARLVVELAVFPTQEAGSIDFFRAQKKLRRLGKEAKRALGMVE